MPHGYRLSKEPHARYLCALPHCQSLVDLPKRSQVASYPHRDRNGFTCNGMLVLFELTDTGKKQAMQHQFKQQIAKDMKMRKRPG